MFAPYTFLCCNVVGLQIAEETASGSEEEQIAEEPEEDIEDPEEDNEDLDGVPLDGAALLKGALNHQSQDDIDGVPSKVLSFIEKLCSIITLWDCKNSGCVGFTV